MLSPDQKRALQGWLDEAKVIVHLPHWEIRADARPVGNPEHIAASTIRHSADASSVALGDGFWTQGVADRRATLAHELLHCHFIRMRQAMRRATKNKAQRDAYDHLEEVTIEHLAHAVAVLLPSLPRELTGKGPK